MDMVRHHHEVGQLVTVAIEMLEARCDNLGHFRAAQYACPVALIQVIVPPIRDQELKFSDQLGIQLVQSSRPILFRRIDSVALEPSCALCLPLPKNPVRNGIPRPPGNERNGSCLRPMRQPSLDDRIVLIRIENLHSSPYYCSMSTAPSLTRSVRSTLG